MANLGILANFKPLDFREFSNPPSKEMVMIILNTE